MRLSDFDYPVPAGRIAQYPLRERDLSALLVLHRHTGKIEHRMFRDITAHLRKGDVLVINDTRVIPVRLRGVKPSGGKAEITLLRELGKNTWEALVKGLHEGTVIMPHGITAGVCRINAGTARVTFDLGSVTQEGGGGDIKDFLGGIGEMPLPPYIKRAAVRSDAEHYQTVYAKKAGAVAAPTAGLHFTEKLLQALRDKGVEIKTITLHVGHGTFRPVTAECIREHKMDEEAFEIPPSTSDAVNAAKTAGRRVIATGTTVTRALESCAAAAGARTLRPGSGVASIFIYPGYRFRIVDALITNFHLPRSTPMMLAAAFSGLDLLKKAYSESVKRGYRLFSYGDAMLII